MTATDYIATALMLLCFIILLWPTNEAIPTDKQVTG